MLSPITGSTCAETSGTKSAWFRRNMCALKKRLLGKLKRGDSYLTRILIHGAHAQGQVGPNFVGTIMNE